jgi:hypothetical protein
MEGKMSHLMDALLADQRRLEADPAYIAPVVAQAERAAQAGFVSMAGQDSRVARLMVENGELRAQIDDMERLCRLQATRISELTDALSSASAALPVEMLDLASGDVAWYSELLGADVEGRLDGEDEPAERHYQLGSLGGDVWLESIRVGGVEMVEHLSESTLAVLLNEALRAAEGLQ